MHILTYLPWIILGVAALLLAFALWDKYWPHSYEYEAMTLEAEFSHRFGHLPSSERQKLRAKLQAFARVRRLASEAVLRDPAGGIRRLPEIFQAEAEIIKRLHGPTAARQFLKVCAESEDSDILYKDALRAQSAYTKAYAKALAGQESTMSQQDREDHIASLRVS